MRKLFLVLFLLVPTLCYSAPIKESDLIGQWEWLGNSSTRSNSLEGLMRSGPSIKVFHADGAYEYISVSSGKKRKPVKGTWKLHNDILIITRPDNGTFKNKIISYKNGILETQDIEFDTYTYTKKK